MISLVEDELRDAQSSLDDSDNALDRAFHEGRIQALDWVLRRLPSEG
jgi:hypothetical protein